MPDPEYRRSLSKSDFTLARSCDAKLYFRENGYSDDRQSDPYLRLLANGGYMVEALAAAKRPEGIFVDHGRSHTEDFERTCALLSRETVTLFQGTILWGRRLARVDILEKRGDTIRLLEVKAKSIDGAGHTERLEGGGLGSLRGSKKPHDLINEWRVKIEEVAFQVLILERVLPGITIQPFLVLVDKSKRSAVDNVARLFDLARPDPLDDTWQSSGCRFIGTQAQLDGLDLLAEVDVSAEVALVRDEVDAVAARYEAMIDGSFDPALAVRGAKCKECEFRPDDSNERSGFAHCWGDLAAVRPHILDLHSIGTVRGPGGTPIVETLVLEGKASIYDVPLDRLSRKDGTIGPVAERQLRQIENTRTRQTWTGPALRPNIEKLKYPLHFIDFEVSRLALPYHARMRPYGQVAFQWSCHTLASPGAVPSHREWLNTSDSWPNKSFALALRDVIGDDGSVLTWSGFEQHSLAEIVAELPAFESSDPDLERWILKVNEHRMVDLNEWAKADFYHPDMRGRTSIKVVLDALWQSDATMREQFTVWTGLPAFASSDPYHTLPTLVINRVPQNVREGTGAVRAYEAMMYGVEKHDASAKHSWCALLLQYCKLDTLSMVLVFEYWRRLTGMTGPPSYPPVVIPPAEIFRI